MQLAARAILGAVALAGAFAARAEDVPPPPPDDAPSAPVEAVPRPRRKPAPCAAPTDSFHATTLLGKEVTLGWILAFDTRVSKVLGRGVVLLGGRMAMLINHSVILGFDAGGVVTEPNAAIGPLNPSGSQSAELAFGGVVLGYSFAPQAVVHPVASVVFGPGVAGTHFTRDPQDGTPDSRVVFVAEPELVLELNLLEHVRLSAGVSYRDVRGVNVAGLGNSDFSRVAAVVMVGIGEY